MGAITDLVGLLGSLLGSASSDDITADTLKDALEDIADALGDDANNGGTSTDNTGGTNNNGGTSTTDNTGGTNNNGGTTTTDNTGGTTTNAGGSNSSGGTTTTDNTGGTTTTDNTGGTNNNGGTTTTDNTGGTSTDNTGDTDTDSTDTEGNNDTDTDTDSTDTEDNNDTDTDSTDKNGGSTASTDEERTTSDGRDDTEGDDEDDLVSEAKEALSRDQKLDEMISDIRDRFEPNYSHDSDSVTGDLVNAVASLKSAFDAYAAATNAEEGYEAEGLVIDALEKLHDVDFSDLDFSNGTVDMVYEKLVDMIEAQDDTNFANDKIEQLVNGWQRLTQHAEYEMSPINTDAPWATDENTDDEDTSDTTDDEDTSETTDDEDTSDTTDDEDTSDTTDDEDTSDTTDDEDTSDTTDDETSDPLDELVPFDGVYDQMIEGLKAPLGAEIMEAVRKGNRKEVEKLDAVADELGELKDALESGTMTKGELLDWLDDFTQYDIPKMDGKLQDLALAKAEMLDTYINDPVEFANEYFVDSLTDIFSGAASNKKTQVEAAITLEMLEKVSEIIGDGTISGDEFIESIQEFQDAVNQMANSPDMGILAQIVNDHVELMAGFFDGDESSLNGENENITESDDNNTQDDNSSENDDDTDAASGGGSSEGANEDSGEGRDELGGADDVIDTESIPFAATSSEGFLGLLASQGAQVVNAGGCNSDAEEHSVDLFEMADDADISLDHLDGGDVDIV